MAFLGHFFELFSFKSNKFDFGQRYPLNLYLKLTTTAVISDMLHENFHLLNSTKYLKNDSTKQREIEKIKGKKLKSYEKFTAK